MNIKEFVKDKDLESLNHIKRWYLNRTIQNENIAEHTFWVIFFTSILMEEVFSEGDELVICKAKLDAFQLSLFHDFDEMFTGDMPHQLKYNLYNGSEIKKCIEDFAKYKLAQKFNADNKFNKMLLRHFDNKNEALYTVVKIADWLSAMKYSYTEITLGNKDFLPIFGYIQDNMKKQVEKSKKVLLESEFEGKVTFDFSIYSQILETNFFEM